MRRDNLSGTKYPINNVDDDDEIVKKFALEQPRKMKLLNILDSEDQ